MISGRKFITSARPSGTQRSGEGLLLLHLGEDVTMVIDANLIIAVPWQYAGIIQRADVGTVRSVFSYMTTAQPSTRSQSLPTMGTGDLPSSASR